jgi:hypothetical protein
MNQIMNQFINKLMIAIILVGLSFNTSAIEQCGEEERKIIEMQERSLNQGTVRRSSIMAYARVTIGSTGMIYALVNSATGIGLLSAVIFVGGTLDIYINGKNDNELDKLEERLCN